jgi:hypothetical protein
MRAFLLLFLYSSSPARAGDYTELVARTSGAVARIIVTQSDGARSEGSGFLVGDGSLVATNFHVIEDAVSVEVAFPDSSVFRASGWVDVKIDADLALIRVPVKRTPLMLATAQPALGTPVIALGNSRGMGLTVSEGIVSRLAVQGGYMLTQHSAPISPGNSGGPLLDNMGNVLGVNSFYISAQAGQNLNFAVSSVHLQALLEGAKKNPNGPTHSVPFELLANLDLVANVYGFEEEAPPPSPFVLYRNTYRGMSTGEAGEALGKVLVLDESGACTSDAAHCYSVKDRQAEESVKVYFGTDKRRQLVSAIVMFYTLKSLPDTLQQLRAECGAPLRRDRRGTDDYEADYRFAYARSIEKEFSPAAAASLADWFAINLASQSATRDAPLSISWEWAPCETTLFATLFGPDIGGYSIRLRGMKYGVR